jgi:hypothetical protein
VSVYGIVTKIAAARLATAYLVVRHGVSFQLTEQEAYGSQFEIPGIAQ